MLKNLRPILCSLKYYYWDRQEHTLKYHLIAGGLFLLLLPAFFQGISWLQGLTLFASLTERKVALLMDTLLRPLLFLYFFSFFYIVQKDTRVKALYFLLYLASLVLAYQMLRQSADLLWMALFFISQLVMASLCYTAFQITELCEFGDIEKRNSSLVHWTLFSLPLLVIFLFVILIYRLL